MKETKRYRLFLYWLDMRYNVWSERFFAPTLLNWFKTSNEPMRQKDGKWCFSFLVPSPVYVLLYVLVMLMLPITGPFAFCKEKLKSWKSTFGNYPLNHWTGIKMECFYAVIISLYYQIKLLEIQTMIASVHLVYNYTFVYTWIIQQFRYNSI